MSPRTPLTPATVILNTAALWAATAIAAAAWWPIYQNLPFVVLAVVATLVGSAIAITGALLRWSSAIVAPVTVLAFAVLGVPLAVPDEAIGGVLPSLPGLLDLFSSVALGWKQLLTITLPVGSYQGLLVPAFVILLLSAVVSLTVALRARHGDLAVIAPVLVFVVGLAFGPRTAQWPLLLSVGLLTISLLWLLWRRWYHRRRAIREVQGAAQPVLGLRTVLSAVVIMAIAGGAAVAVTGLVPPTGPREVLRSAVEQPFDPRDYPSPLSGFRQYLRDDSAGAVMFTVRGLPEGTRIRIATLDSYDGLVYAVGSARLTSESGSFTRVPYVFDQSAVAGDQIAVDVEIGAYRGVWLPTVGKFESVSFAGDRASTLRESFFYNDTASTAAVIGGVETGDSYRLEAVLPSQPTASQLAGATAGSATVPALGTVPAELATVLESYVGGADSQGARLLAMIEGLRSEGYISHGLGDDEPSSRSGHAADRITQLLSDQRMIGDAEQYAVTAALMARELGFAARVVFGFQPDESGEVTGDMVTAWIEVSTAQYGWVTLDPVPPVRDIPEEQPEDPSEVSRPQSVITPPDEERDLTDNQTPVETSPNDQPVVEGWLLVLLAVARVLGWTLLGIALVLAPFIVIIAAKLRRRQLRRRAASPLQQISGGWREFEDAALDHGYALPRHGTRSELAAAVGGQRPLAVAAVTDRAVFAPVEPSADDAAELWRSIDELTADLGAGRSRWERLRARVSVRSLGGRRALRRSRGRSGGRS
jgi:hypothetical protein